MKITATDKFWVVRNPSELSVLGDVLFECTIEALGYYLVGSNAVNRIASDENLTIYTDGDEAKKDALSRLAARQ